MTGLSGKMAIVTGAGRGIGRAVAIALAGAGARLALMARTQAEIEAVRRELADPAAGRGTSGAAPAGRAGGALAAAIRCDVTDAASVRAAVEAAERELGPAGILVNAAGDAASETFVRTDEALWSRMILVNLTGTYLMTRQVVPGMIERGTGRIINVASLAGLTGAPYVAAYTAAKHGVVGLTRSLAQELAKHGITVNAVCPGYVDTPMTERSVANIARRTGMTQEQARGVLEARSPQNRMITPQEVAALVRHLASDEARGINGQAIVIDGGGLVA